MNDKYITNMQHGVYMLNTDYLIISDEFYHVNMNNPIGTITQSYSLYVNITENKE